jgi:LmbE family N-acetylglucosaminyl deacetylase
MFGRRILIAVPHPDDEVVACCAATFRARTEGASIFALYMTNGCIAQDTLWPWQRRHYKAYVARRQAEAREAARLLGITPVGWSTRPARHLSRHLPEALGELRDAVAAHRIDELWVPAYEGGNADHDALNALGSLMRDHCAILEFAEYNFFGGNARAQTFPFPDGREQTLMLTPEERDLKRRMLALYSSEKKNLGYVGMERECFRPLAGYDYARPPHPGTLWYARFQWVPFRHPRVDFTRPAALSRTLARFVSDSKDSKNLPRVTLAG